jgi:hypothetical protein
VQSGLFFLLTTGKEQAFFAPTQKSPGCRSARAHLASFNFTNNLIWAMASRKRTSPLLRYPSAGVDGFRKSSTHPTTHAGFTRNKFRRIPTESPLFKFQSNTK